ncbi:hypothetical protein J1605_018073 [Eschrichtius robustus]|uniref:Glucokinase regulatory protein n=1 Tax=Eschrichtius robustus TaxID=9764 RepID=A0AB34HXA5_ESCRO|nr:hypothetical protein J1605_018073 [Eschrichtius robustus]
MPGTKRFQHVIETPEPGKWELSGYEAALPITEKSNPLTRDLYKADAEQIVRLLGQCDPEIFQEEGQVMPTCQVAAGKKRVIVIGISVGLSAPFVAGQMDYCMDNPAVFLPVLMGFNPFLLGVITLQPEGLNGSSRIKGGSATKILLETLLLAAHKTVDRSIAASPRCLLEILRTSEWAHQTLGIIAIMDGVECIHTFGAEVDTVVFIFTLDDNLKEVQMLVEQVKEKTSNIQALAHSTTPLKKLFPSIISITWPLLFFEYHGEFIQKFQHELSAKWVLNTGQPKARCIESLLQVIHFPQPLLDDIRAAPISFHVQVAHEKEQVIPIASLSLLFRCSIPEAQAYLAAAPSVREAVRSALTRPGRKRNADLLETLDRAVP